MLVCVTRWSQIFPFQMFPSTTAIRAKSFSEFITHGPFSLKMLWILAAYDNTSELNCHFLFVAPVWVNPTSKWQSTICAVPATLPASFLEVSVNTAVNQKWSRFGNLLVSFLRSAWISFWILRLKNLGGRSYTWKVFLKIRPKPHFTHFNRCAPDSHRLFFPSQDAATSHCSSKLNPIYTTQTIKIYKLLSYSGL